MELSQTQAMVPRAALLQLLQSAKQSILYIHAPAGYGKSIAAQLWCAQDSRPCAGVLLDEFDNTMLAFCKRFCAGLEALAPGYAPLQELVHHPAFVSAPEEYTMHAAASMPPGLSARMVLDDLQILSNDAVVRLLGRLLRRVPQGIQLMILSRQAPPAAFTDLVVKGTLAVITAAQLEFSPEEIRQLYQSRGKAISIRQAQSIYHATGGWAIGINALQLSGGAAIGRKLMNEQLEQFIQTQIWEKWDERIRAFMLHTAQEEELSVPLCEALTGEPAEELLQELVRNHMFIMQSGDDAYRFHSLFRSFLLHLLEEQEPLRRIQLNKAGVYYLRTREYYKAAEAFIGCGNGDMLMETIRTLLYTADTGGFVIDMVLDIIKKPAIQDLMKLNPYLLGICAWEAFLEGRPDDMERDMDRYYQNIPQIMKEAPEIAAHVYYLRLLDYRVPLKQLALEIGALQDKGELEVISAAGTVTQYMPLFHRSSRDASEYAGGAMVREVRELHDLVAPLIGKEHRLLESCMIGGLHYERGELTEAHRVALAALSGLEDDFSPESRLCILLLYIHILRAQWQFPQAMEMMERMEVRIREDKAYYLSFNAEAYRFHARMYQEDAEAAKEWLDTYGTDPMVPVNFFHMYGFFTTARAYLVLGMYDSGILVLNRLLRLAQRYRRPLDVLEAKVLLAIAFWRKLRGYQKEGLAYLEEAVLEAYPYGYTQVFVNEGADLASMLYRLQSRANRKNYTGQLPGSFTKMLYMAAAAHAKRCRGLCGSKAGESIQFTRQQMRVMELLCRGYSYRQIAEELGIKFSTVRSHMELIYKKLDAPNEMEAVQKIRELGILEEA